tara:strand:+ start:60 stop:614 length:555 start_codon:yes stop_codon:yes gene_type:complete
MWKQNKLGGYVQTPTKEKSRRSGWAPHPETGETVWYDAKNDTYRDKFKGPARDALSIGWQMVGGKRAENVTRLLIKGGKKVVPPLYKATKKTIGDAKEVIDDAVTSTKNLAKELLVSKTSPSITAKDATGITKDLEKKKQDVIDLDKNIKESSTPPPKVINEADLSKKGKEKLIINKLSGLILE